MECDATKKAQKRRCFRGRAGRYSGQIGHGWAGESTEQSVVSNQYSEIPKVEPVLVM